MFDSRSKQLGLLLFVLDMLLVVLGFLVAYQLREMAFAHNPAEFGPHAALVPLVMVLLGFLLWRGGAYRGLKAVSVLGYGWLAARAMAVTIALLLTLVFMLKAEYVSRSLIIIFAGITTSLLILVRTGAIWWYVRKAIKDGEDYLKVLIIGTGGRAVRLAEAIRGYTEWGIDIVGHLDVDRDRVGTTVGAAKVIGSVDNISEVLKDHVIDEVIIAIPRNMIQDVQGIADACEEEGVRLRFMADVLDLSAARMELIDIGGIPLLTLEPVAQNELQLVFKRLLDVMLVVGAMPLVLPLMGLVALAIKLDSPGPVLFKQTRVGLHKRTFQMLKFRSMVEGSDAKQKELEALNEAEGPIFKIKDDPRITRVGRLLRRTSLDELPQLFNVLKGDMSLVGPRPMSLRDVRLFDRGIQRKRFSVKPGLTCLWQISGRSNLPFAKWLELDLSYIENWSLGLDLKILMKTIPVVLLGRGAV
ncbi:MAG: sugar transferase [Gammaproteobacteria bacterium]|nr:sugar transferase [Gammaproteobacteria bacterium]NIR85956.1 sugar transferase [Gammaproteobacteria bacterium]NIU06408.1 sugar transferase [Gammaproteobacteria bacterium]NIV53302.1 exopolysaccharide biosynthesis polyprenyl glycosylphosphotransferase [Gammaproteobacteria bacterium]NIV76959.1 exopolysaccharide biosynthesis polyprenyl glycosylphosphotransferase [Gammaproteobacteria bacterium]